MLRDHPVDSAQVKEWITNNKPRPAGTDAPKALAIVDTASGLRQKEEVVLPRGRSGARAAP